MKSRCPTMASSAHKKKILPLLIAIIFVFGADADNESKLHKQPNHINKHIIKSIQTEDGDIMDCVDIYKQPAFDHPLLKNHTIQMKPEGISKQMLSEISMENISSQSFVSTIQCPEGYVPIKRTSAADQAMHKYFKPLGLESLSDYVFLESVVYFKGNKSFGASGSINVWSPENVSVRQTTSGEIRIIGRPVDNLNYIAAGWMVHPGIYGDQKPRFYIYWTADNAKTTGCFDLLCPGFILTSSSTNPGRIIESSIYGGDQKVLSIRLVRDGKSKNWWLVRNGETVGYWPEQILPGLREGGDLVSWGGHVTSLKDEASPPMGSGHFPSEAFKKAAYIRTIKVIHTSNDASFVDPPDENTYKNNNVNSYDVEYLMSNIEPFENHLYFGGPGGHKEK